MRASFPGLRWREGFCCTNHRVAGDKSRELFFTHPRRALRPLRYDDVSLLGSSIPHVHLNIRIERQAELLQDLTWLVHDSRSVGRRLKPDGRDSEQGPRITGAERAKPDVVFFLGIEEGSHVLRLKTSVTKFGDGGCAVILEAFPVRGIDPRL